MMNTFKYKTKSGQSTYQSLQDSQFKKYVLEISPTWKSSLGGNASAILVEASHDQNQYAYKALWANFSTSETEFEFRGEDLTQEGPDIDIIMFEPYQNDETKRFINNSIDQYQNKIKIVISREFDGIISFKLTPIMSYGPLHNLAKTINIDQSKIASGEVFLSKWSYTINKYLSNTVTRTPEVSVKTEDITTVTTTNENVESKKVITKTSVVTEDAETVQNYKYSMNLNYGFDSYVFKDQQITETRFIKFYNMQDIDINKFGNLDPNSIIRSIIDSNEYIPEHVEIVPENVFKGGSITLNYNLNTSECPLQYGNCYLAIVQMQSNIKRQDVEVQIEYFDYRYLFVSPIFNELFGQIEDFNTLYLPIIPQMNINFGDNRIYENYTQDSVDTSISKLEDQFVWVSDQQKNEQKISFDYNLTINTEPSYIEFNYIDDHFNTSYVQLTKDPNLKLVNKSLDSIPYNNDILSAKSEKDIKGDEITLTKNYTFNINCNTKVDEIYINSLKTNLLNLHTDTNNPGLFLAESEGLANTMMLEDENLLVVGIHNDGDDSGDEEWYGEIGSAGEGYTVRRADRVYDDSKQANASNEIDLKYHLESTSEEDECHYFIKHGKFKKQFGIEKDDPSEVLADYITSNDADSYITKSLQSKSVLPTLFMTSGYHGESPDKKHNGVTVNIDGYSGVSQRADGNTDEDEDLNEVEQHNFTEDYPYWFLEDTLLHPYSWPQVLGTFLLKYAINKKASSYTCTNNYFAVYADPLTNAGTSQRGYAVYLEDLKYSGDTDVIYSKDKPTSTKSFIMTSCQSNLKDVNGKPLHYSIGDLLATQLAQFGSIVKYSTPQKYEGVAYSLNDTDSAILQHMQKDVISYTPEYRFTFNRNTEAYQKLNENLQFINVKLSDWNVKLQSNNLQMDIPADNSDLVLTYKERLEFTPLSSLLPDLKEKSYMLEISPYGDIKYKVTPEITSQLFYWDGQNYVIYNTNGVELYKYGKFSKFIPEDGNIEGKNSSNYEVHHSYISALDNFIKFNPNDTLSSAKHKVQIPLSYSDDNGLYTTNNKNRNTSAFYRFREMHGKNWEQPPVAQSKTLKGLSATPLRDTSDKTSKNIKIYVDSTQRL